MTTSVMVAMADNGVIGRRNGLPWRQSADLKRVKAVTSGHTVIMGRKTFESVGRPLPNRRNIVVSRSSEFRPGGVTVAPTLEAAFELAKDDGEVFVMGGAEIYRQAWPHVDRLYLTLVHAAPEGDAYLQLPPLDDWKLVSSESHPADEQNEFPYEFRLYEKRGLRGED
ncbi:MAG TPA: dihydrofolate reductase [Gemmatimonadales bacterium]|nr:dihydrofolate reductase [Gemmatimonadales bacterium]